MQAQLMTYPKLFIFAFLLLFTNASFAADIDPFIGSYAGTVSGEGDASSRDMSVDIIKTDEGFKIIWKTIEHKPDGRITEKQYDIMFLSTGRAGIYSSAMETNIFGKPVPLARIIHRSRDF